jgi:hypothetical protein
MNRRIGVVALCVAGVCLSFIASRGQAAGKSDELRAALVGTWKMTSMKVNGQKNTLPEQGVTYKHVTPAGFVWVSYEKDTGKMFRAAGGTWTLAGDAYTEKIEYGMGDDFDVIKNASHAFQCRIEGDTWHHNGKLANGTTIDEVWTRVKPAEAATAAATASDKRPAAPKQP